MVAPALAGIFGAMIGRATAGVAARSGMRSMAQSAGGTIGGAASSIGQIPSNLTMTVKHLVAIPGHAARMRGHTQQANSPLNSPIMRKIHRDEANYEGEQLKSAAAALGMALKGTAKGFAGLAAAMITFPKIAQSLGENQLNRQIDRFSPFNAEYRNIAAADKSSRDRKSMVVARGTEGSSKALQEALANLRQSRTETSKFSANVANIAQTALANIGWGIAETLNKTGIAKAANNWFGGGVPQNPRMPHDEFIEDVMRGKYVPKKSRLDPPPKIGRP